MKLKISVINKSPHPLPKYETAKAAGMDLRAWLPEKMSLKPLERRLVPTGLYMALPDGLEAQIRPRSGMAMKKGITLINAPGTIDADYRGEILIPVINLSETEQFIEDGDRIAQMIIAKYEQIAWELSEGLPETPRGEGGFGHSGIH